MSSLEPLLQTSAGIYRSIEDLHNLSFPNYNYYYYYYEVPVNDIYHLTADIDKFGILAILSFGIPANILAAIVFLARTFRQTSFGVNLVGKSLSDALFLVCALIVWLERVEIHLLHKPGICQAVVYLTYVSAFTSVWFVVALALENLIRIRYPFRVPTLCQLRNAVIAITVMVVFAIAIYFPTIWINSVDDIEGLGVCQMSQTMTLVSSAYTYMDSLLTLLAPCGLVIVFIVMTLEAVCRSMARSRKMFLTQRRSFSVVIQQQITRMLSAVSIVFIILTFPSHMTRVILLVSVWRNGRADISPEQYLTQHVFQLFYYLSFAINLLIYVTFCPKVRTSIVQSMTSLCPVSTSDNNSARAISSVSISEHVSSSQSSAYNKTKAKTSNV